MSNVESRIEKHLARSESYRHLLEVLAVVGEEIARSNLISSLKELGRAPCGRAWNTTRIGDALDELPGDVVVKSGGYFQIEPGFRPVMLDYLMTTGRLDTIAEIVQRRLPIIDPKDQYFHTERLIRDVNLAYRTSNSEKLVELYAMARKKLRRRYDAGTISDVLETDVSATKLFKLEPSAKALIMAEQVRRARRELQSPEPWLGELEALVEKNAVPLDVVHELARQELLRGDVARARQRLVGRDDEISKALEGWACFVSGDVAGANEAFEVCRGPARQLSQAHAALRFGPEVLFLVLTLLAQKTSTRRLYNFLRELDELVDPHYECQKPLMDLYLMHGPDSGSQHERSSKLWRLHALREAPSFWRTWLDLLADIGGDVDISEQMLSLANRALAKAHDSGYRWVAAELADALRRAGHDEDLPADAQTLGGPEWQPVLPLLGIQPRWKRLLEGLERAVAPPLPIESLLRVTSSESDESAVRLAWIVSESKWGGRLEVEPREQRRSAPNKPWSKGRKIALKRLYGEPEIDFATERDLPVCDLIYEDVQIHRGYRDVSYYINDAEALEALAGHPYVFWLDDRKEPLTITSGTPELHVTREEDAFEVRLEPPVGPRELVALKDGPYQIRVVRTSELQQKVGEVIGEGLTFPLDAEERLREVVTAVSDRITVHTDLDTPLASPDVEAEARPVVQLARVGEGVQARLRARPFGPAGPTLKSGRGSPILVAELEGEQRTTRRDLDAEAALAEPLRSLIESLAGSSSSDDEWLIPELEQSLDLVRGLSRSKEEVEVEWSAGRPLRLARDIAQDDLRLQIRAARVGFELDGQIVLDDARSVGLLPVLSYLESSPSRFVKLDDETFAMLTEGFHRRLEELSRVTLSEKGDKRTIHPFATEPLEALAQEVRTLKAGKNWKKHLKQLREARVSEPTLPTTLRAELRDYQSEGFHWLAKLSALGAGACLADDMGLGKTVQTLALLLARAKDGPALVAAPTSVVASWESQARRFAPTLSFRRLEQKNREDVVREAGPFDVVLCSHGILSSEAALLGEREWSTVVLDEAQAFKNPATRRAKAAIGLRAGFRIALTGTPIENRLEDLWSIFRFIVPGLLSTREAFRRRFARPIEQQKDRRAQRALRELIRPFLLRRTKALVLDELPAKTEMTVEVELSAAEAALYEALRQRALEELSKTENNEPIYMRVLTHITRLRRLCCHSRLVVPEHEAPPSSKLLAFEALLDELLEGGHKALVFSQFVDHLEIVRGVLEARGVSYQLLQGDTPERARRERIDAFQAGDGDVFLISLRAGGTGLDLTAADYVIHLDPWWNPAVEDQASDRTHRIGQTRPVTVLRLVTRGTIEEKILALHKEKRELSDQLIRETDQIAPIDAEALLALLEEEHSTSSEKT